MYDNSDYDMTPTEFLEYKDELYEKIFGTPPSKFLISNNGDRIISGIPSDRNDYYTDAEVLFGQHVIISLEAFVELLVDLTMEIIGVVLPPLKIAGITQQIGDFVVTLFFATSILDFATSLVEGFIDNYIENGVEEDSIGLYKWPMALFNVLSTIYESVDNIFIVQNFSDMKIYDKIAAQNNYRAYFKDGSRAMFIDNILSHCENS